MNALLQQVKTAKLSDQTVVQKYEAVVTPAGKTIARFVGYVEMGQRPQTYQGKPKPAAMLAYLFFELLGKNHQRTLEDGSTAPIIHMERVTIKTGEKANFRKLFMKMRADDSEITHIAQCLSRGYILDIKHSQSEDGSKTYANCRDADGTWLVAPPRVEDPLTGDVREVPIPEPRTPYKLLLWDQPSKEQWESIFIDGSYTKTDAKGVETEVSRNWMQNDIRKNAVNFEGSALHDLLIGLGDLDFNDDVVDHDDLIEPGEHSDQAAGKAEPQSEPEQERVAEPEQKPAEKPAEKEPEAPAKDVDEMMAALGL